MSTTCTTRRDGPDDAEPDEGLGVGRRLRRRVQLERGQRNDRGGHRLHDPLGPPEHAEQHGGEERGTEDRVVDGQEDVSGVHGTGQGGDRAAHHRRQPHERGGEHQLVPAQGAPGRPGERRGRRGAAEQAPHPGPVAVQQTLRDPHREDERKRRERHRERQRVVVLVHELVHRGEQHHQRHQQPEAELLQPTYPRRRAEPLPGPGRSARRDEREHRRQHDGPADPVQRRLDRPPGQVERERRQGREERDEQRQLTARRRAERSRPSGTPTARRAAPPSRASRSSSR